MNKILLAVFAIILLHGCGGPEESPYIYTEDGTIIVGEDGEPIELINNPNASNPTYTKLLAFIMEDSTDEQPFTSTFTCGDFAEAVHNNAEEAGIKGAFVDIYFEGEDKGHALNAFETTNRGLVYIDCAREDFSVFAADDGLSSWDKVAYVEVGKEYGLLPLADADGLSYSFYQQYKNQWQTRAREVESYNLRVSRFDEEVEQFYRELEKRQLHVVYTDDGWAIDMNVRDEQLDDWSEMTSWAIDLAIEAEQLDARAEQLDNLREGLGDYLPKPLGIVEEINIYW